ncbi:transcription factor tau 138 kDa subunit [[Candida] jaroonii]|uniref:Transcription factor tau 138 kDa subunit n=1 Tax=[Candida] jaroonii TaxID=467808 RepID=A0ACA9Y716_9ASCO|nr:transcription factor tau 138 kDa subunit [[Candida] jaroonii]
MVFSCTPIELLSFLLEKLAFSGNNGITMNELWGLCDEKLNSKIDNFEKQIIWNWLFFDKYSNSLFIWNNSQKVSPTENYEEFLLKQVNDENLIRVFATSDTQWDYLVGKDVTEQMKSQLGKHPYELLCAVAQAGPSGVISANLHKLTGQDPRSLTPRLKKLEEFNLIIRKATYSKSLGNTSICIHKKFANESSEVSTVDFEEFKITRDANKLRPLILKKVKEAPNQLRSLMDLRLEFGLGENKSTSRFFRSIVGILCSQGYLRKVMAKQESGQNAYCVQFIKDVSDEENSKSANFLDLLLGDDVGQEEEEEFLPSYSNIFPITNQIYQLINSQPKGCSSMDIAKKLTGLSEHRSFVRLMDPITSIVIENNKEKKLKKSEIYDGVRLKRSFDFEGKFKFYRYFGQGDQDISEVFKFVKQNSGKLSKVNTEKQSSIGKLMNGSLMSKKRKVDEPDKTTKKAKVRKTRAKVQVSEDDSAMIPVDEETPEREPTKIEIKSEPVGFQPPLNFNANEKTKVVKDSSKPASLKAVKRREVLLELIKESGGVVFTSATLRRTIDRRLNNGYDMDNKTLSRDIASMVNDKILECENIDTVKSGKPITRKLLILTNPRPSEEKIEQIRLEGEIDTGLNSRILVDYNKVPHTEDNVTIFNPKPERKRLDNLSKPAKSNSRTIKAKIRIKSEPGTEGLETSAKPRSRTKEKADFETIVNSTLMAKQKKRTKKTEAKGPKTRKSRTLKLSEHDTSMMYNIFIISRTFKRSIDYEHLSTYFEGLSAKDLQQKWSSLRKNRGGSDAVMKGVRRFEKIVSKAVDLNKIKAEHLNPIDYKYFLELWDSMDSATSKSSKRLYLNAKDNYDDYLVTESNEVMPPVSEQIMFTSMIQKEEVLANTPFLMNRKDVIYDEKVDKIKTTLNSLLHEGSFSKGLLEKLFGDGEAEIIRDIVEIMVKDRDAALIDQNFRLTEKFSSSLCPSRLITQFHQGNNFVESIDTLFEKPIGIIVSQGINDSHMMPLLSLISNNGVSPIHVDKTYKFSSYESRLIDKSNLDCDIVIHGKPSQKQPKHVPVPTGKIASHVWYKSDASVDTDLWSTIIVSVVWHILFRPGVRKFDLYHKFKSVLSHYDLDSVLQWLVQSEFLRSGRHDDYWITNQPWYSIVG